MKIGVTSQNFRTITGHAGKARRFLIFGQDDAGRPVELERLDLPKEMSLHEYHNEDHPIFEVDFLITAGSGQGFIQRLAAHGVQVITTSETDPNRAAGSVFSGESLPPAAPNDHQHGHEVVMPS